MQAISQAASGSRARAVPCRRVSHRHPLRRAHAVRTPRRRARARAPPSSSASSPPPPPSSAPASSPGDIDYAVIGQVVQAGAGHIPSRQVTLGVGRARGDRLRHDQQGLRLGHARRRAGRPDGARRRSAPRCSRAAWSRCRTRPTCSCARARATASATASCSTRTSSDGLRDPWSGKLMYEQASAVADELGLARADLDEWALRSHQRASPPSTRGAWPRRSSPSRCPDAAARRSSTPTRRRAATRRSSAWPRSRRSTTRTRRTRPATRPASTTAPRCSSSPTPTLARERNLEPLARILATGCTANRHDSLARVPGAGRADRARARRPDRGRHGRDRDQRGLRLGRRCSRRAISASTPSASTSTAARSRSAIRSARRARGWSARSSTSCAAAAAGAAWPRSARAAGRATRS